MPSSSLLAIAVAIFLAELGDKTQIAVLAAAAANKEQPFLVFGASILALSLSTLLAVIVGRTTAVYFTQLPIQAISGVIFVAIGLFMLYRSLA